MNNYKDMSTYELFDLAKESLEAASRKNENVPDNQLGMPIHLGGVAMMVGDTLDILAALQKKLVEDGKRWQNAINGENQEGGKKASRRSKRSQRKTRKTRKTRRS
jgi:hypothetical protein